MPKKDVFETVVIERKVRFFDEKHYGKNCVFL